MSTRLSQSEIPYHGQQIIPLDSFLRKMPHCVADRTRLEFDAVVMASDIISLSYNRLRALAIELGQARQDVSELSIAEGIGSCWSIVDQLHAVSQLIRVSGKKGDHFGPKTTELLACLSVATKQRNKMDHLKDNIGNLSKKLGPRSPLFGSFSYFFVTNPENMSGSAVTMYSGSLIGEQLVPLLNPAAKTFVLPVGLFEFSAFDEILEIEPTLQKLLDYYAFVGPDIEQQIKSAAANHAQEQGTNLEELLASARGSFIFAGEFGSPPDSDPNVG